MKAKKIPFIDAQAMHLSHPDTFDAPEISELDKLKAQDLVKVCPDVDGASERFWAQIESIDGETIIARVDNGLIHTEGHGLACNDLIEFEKKNIYEIYYWRQYE